MNATPHRPKNLKPDPSAPGARVKWLRKYLGKSGVEFARILSYDQSALSRIESGKRPIPRELAIQIADMYGITTDFLLQGRTRGLLREWLDRLLASPQGIALISPDDIDYAPIPR